jgi:hypothetical protein
MSDKKVDELSVLFHDQSKFVHMSGTWKKKEELEIIKTGSIWYKKLMFMMWQQKLVVMLPCFGVELP